MPPVFSYMTFSDLENDHITLQLFLDADFNATSLSLNLYPTSNNEEDIFEEPEHWDNPEYLLKELFPGLQEYFQTGKINRLVYELTEDFSTEEILSIYTIFIKCFEFAEGFEIDLNNINNEGTCTCPNCSPRE